MHWRLVRPEMQWAKKKECPKKTTKAPRRQKKNAKPLSHNAWNSPSVPTDNQQPPPKANHPANANSNAHPFRRSALPNPNSKTSSRPQRQLDRSKHGCSSPSIMRIPMHQIGSAISRQQPHHAHNKKQPSNNRPQPTPPGQADQRNKQRSHTTDSRRKRNNRQRPQPPNQPRVHEIAEHDPINIQPKQKPIMLRRNMEVLDVHKRRRRDVREHRRKRHPAAQHMPPRHRVAQQLPIRRKRLQHRGMLALFRWPRLRYLQESRHRTHGAKQRQRN